MSLYDLFFGSQPKSVPQAMGFGERAAAAGWQGGQPTQLPDNMGFTPLEKKMAWLGNYAVNDSIPAEMAKAAYRGFTLPGRVFTGETQMDVYDPSTGEMVPNPQVVGDAAELAGLVTLGAGAIPADDSLRMGMKAYHGSPHDFDKFQMNKTGTGEGAQAYGHGLYFAENEATAKAYRDTLTPKYRAEKKIAERIAANSAYADDLRKQLSALDPSSPEAKTIGDRVSFFEESNARLSAAPNGRMYEVDIKADPDQFLNYDAPFAEQSKVAQNFLEQEMRRYLGTRYDGYERQFKEMTAGELLDQTKGRMATAPATTEEMKQAGLKGIRYFDQGSRADGDGSRNMVVFDENIIEILRKYGIGGLLMGGAGLATGDQLSQQDRNGS